MAVGYIDYDYCYTAQSGEQKKGLHPVTNAIPKVQTQQSTGWLALLLK